MDCIEYMRSLPDNVFDIAVCDPPYGKGNDDNLVMGGGRFGQRFEKYFRPQGGGKKSRPAHIETLRGKVQALRQADGTDCREDGEKDTTSQRTHWFSGGTWAERYKIGGQSRSSTMGRRSSTGVLR